MPLTDGDLPAFGESLAEKGTRLVEKPLKEDVRVLEFLYRKITSRPVRVALFSVFAFAAATIVYFVVSGMSGKKRNAPFPPLAPGTDKTRAEISFSKSGSPFWLELPENGPNVFLKSGTTTLGASAANDIRLDRETVSGTHASFFANARECLVTDLQSSNGTYVNGVRIRKPSPLVDGDELLFGAVRIRLRRKP
ncbi:MAG: FHA domain-containing protein [Deltaproteobacteria bacterium]|nr:FHA domain-containing protein [Deltaproteobacteria bacterium]